MKFTCTKENLEYSLSLVSSLASKHTNLPILSNVLIKTNDSGIEVSATNLEIAVKTQLRAKVEEQGSFTVPAKTLTDYIRLLTNEQVEISKKDNELLITSGNSSTKIKGSTDEDYPILPEVEELNSYVLQIEDLKSAIAKVIIAVAKNEIRPELSGIFFSFFSEKFDGLVLAATDSYRLAEAKIKVSQGETKDIKCIVPSRVAYEINRLLQAAKSHGGEDIVRVWISDNQIAIRYDNFEMTSRLIDGKYPDYTQIIPDNFKTTAVFPLDVMVNKIKAASLFTSTGVNAVSFDLNVTEKNIGVSSSSTQAGEHSSAIDVDIEGEENSILLNHSYVLDGLSHMESDNVVFGVNSKDAPCIFRPQGKDDYLYIVMPIRQ
ncbi:MAG: DNA polymerase III, beta subunit [uncultured bacterium]|nr:MAG: DNA polymerase III, beta subunit [uncultured bacterium]MDD2656158.1 DNA polymerase III subunit beta [Patescibacteria group bacterium]OGH83949.1 MAG: DNA polymerase III subunit beta [Candidatus Magasanikbacteria bacterium RIFOXYC12_FULL_32_21b]OGH90950.1 MAG: DNA polymerase III subunit beta [Candidatus Magasanikbacteria bacterium RIFOXYD12_FULL_33_17]HAO52404.1 DNA polymerase III subunit beta [Candidatus Magasanikbacteria bacterium]